MELYETDGAEGAARAAGLGVGYFASADEAFSGLTRTGVIEPDAAKFTEYKVAYEHWVKHLPANGV